MPVWSHSCLAIWLICTVCSAAGPLTRGTPSPQTDASAEEDGAKMLEDAAKEKMKAMDKNKDGKLTHDEVMAGLEPSKSTDDATKADLEIQARLVTEIFPQADGNSDGLLDLAELGTLIHTVHIYKTHVFSPEPEEEKMVAMDANKDGKLSHEEIVAALQPSADMDDETKAELHKQAIMVASIFPQVDEDNDHLLDLAELRALMHSYHLHQTHLLTPESPEEKMKALDTNSDRKLSLEEIMAALHTSEAMDEETKAQLQLQANLVTHMFPQTDGDNDGMLDMAELGALMHAVHVYQTNLLSTEPEEGQMEAMDANKDGKLSLDEIKAALETSGDMDDATKTELDAQATIAIRVFSQADGDNDGLLDLVELRALMQHIGHSRAEEL